MRFENGDECLPVFIFARIIQQLNFISLDDASLWLAIYAITSIRINPLRRNCR